MHGFMGRIFPGHRQILGGFLRSVHSTQGCRSQLRFDFTQVSKWCEGFVATASRKNDSHRFPSSPPASGRQPLAAGQSDIARGESHAKNEVQVFDRLAEEGSPFCLLFFETCSTLPQLSWPYRSAAFELTEDSLFVCLLGIRHSMYSTSHLFAMSSKAQTD